MLPTWFIEAEALKSQTLSCLEAMTPEARRRVPKVGEWSPLEVAAHIVLIEQLTATDWQEVARKSPGATPGMRGDFVVGAVIALLRSPFRLPSVPFAEPTAPADLAALSVQWDAVRVRIRETIPANPNALWVVHPIFGALSAAQIGFFLAEHLRHHLLHLPFKK